MSRERGESGEETSGRSVCKKWGKIIKNILKNSVKSIDFFR